MADDKPETSGKRRRPTTIDLKATEVASEPGKPSEPVENTPEMSHAGSPSEAPAAAQPAHAKPKPDWLGTAALNERLSSMRRDFARRLDWRLIGAGAAGAAAMFVLVLAAYAGGAFTPRDATAPLVSQVAGLERQMRDLASRPQPAPVDPRPLADLAARVAAGEQAIGKIDAKIENKIEAASAAPRPAQADPALAGRVAALETALRPLTDSTARIDSASATAREAKSRADAAYEAAQKTGASIAPGQKEIDDLTARVAALEQATKTADARITTTAGADRAGRLAFTAAVLRATVARGEPFARELDAVRPLVADAKLLSPLEPFAATGVPSDAVLSRELSQLSGAMLAAVGTPPRSGGFIDRLQATGLIRIRPISEGPGDDPTTVIGRADVKATHGDLAGARKDIAALPPAVQAPAQAWIARLDARDAALAAARDLAESAIGTLAKP